MWAHWARSSFRTLITAYGWKIWRGGAKLRLAINLAPYGRRQNMLYCDLNSVKKIGQLSTERSGAERSGAERRPIARRCKHTPDIVKFLLAGARDFYPSH
jgi:hypothetical protein